MEVLGTIGTFTGFAALFFGALALFVYMRIKKLISLLDDEQLKEAEVIIRVQSNRVKRYLIIFSVLMAITVILNIIVAVAF